MWDGLRPFVRLSGGRLRRFLLLGLLLLILRDGLPDRSRAERIKAQINDYEFNYISWELDALWQKARQVLFGFQQYVTDEESKALVIEYLLTVGQIFDLEGQIDAIYADPAVTDPNDAARDLQGQVDDLEQRRRDLQPLVEPLIERQVATVLQEEGFSTLGQVLPPLAMHLVETPDVLVVSPRNMIRQDFAISLKSVDAATRSQIEQNVEAVSPEDAAYVTGTGGVGLWPAMIVQSRYAAITFEVVAHEWSHNYLFMFPLGMQYLALPETRIINETTATVFGNALALKVLERFYADEVARGLIYIPIYPTLNDFLGRTPPVLADRDVPVTGNARYSADFLLQNGQEAAAQWMLNTATPLPLTDPDLAGLMPAEAGVEINRARITADFLLALGKVEAAEAFMESRRQRLGMRVLNQAWFAFHGGYQSDPGQGGGVSLNPVVDVTDPAFLGDPIGPAIHEIMELAPTTEDYLVALRDVTNRQELIAVLIEARAKWGQNTQNKP